MRDECGALHFEILHALPGRLRVHLEKPIESHQCFERVRGVIGCRYNPRIQTLLCRYDPEAVSEEKLIQTLAAIYAVEIGADRLHVKRSEEDGFSMSATGALALAMIGIDGALNLSGSTLTGITRWFSTGATLAAVVEHAYQELQVRGSFDPEVMAVVYLINSIGKTNSVQASLVAWAATFGRHLILRDPREQVYSVKRNGVETTLIPAYDRRNGADFAGAMLRRGTEILTRAR